jgi:hypothetical protein
MVHAIALDVLFRAGQGQKVASPPTRSVWLRLGHYPDLIFLCSISDQLPLEAQLFNRLHSILRLLQTVASYPDL